MKVPNTPPSIRCGKAAPIQLPLNSKNCKSVISPDAMANSLCCPRVTLSRIFTLYGSSVKMTRHSSSPIRRASTAGSVASPQMEVLAKAEHVAKPADRCRALIWRERTLLCDRSFVGHDDLIDLVEAEADASEMTSS